MESAEERMEILEKENARLKQSVATLKTWNGKYRFQIRDMEDTISDLRARISFLEDERRPWWKKILG